MPSLALSVAARSLSAVAVRRPRSSSVFSGRCLVGGYRVPAGAQPPAKGEPVPAKVEAAPSLEAPLPAGAIARLGTTLFRHNNGSNSSVLSKDGKILVTTGKTTIAVWDTATGQRKHMIRNCGIADGFTSASQRIALSPDGTLLANFSEYEVEVRVWDLTTGKQAYSDRCERAADQEAAGARRAGRRGGAARTSSRSTKPERNSSWSAGTGPGGSTRRPESRWDKFAWTMSPARDLRRTAGGA